MNRNSSTSISSKHIGRLYVSVLAGQKLAVKDVFSSDPYVLVTVDGSQQKKTSTKFKTLNPDWTNDKQDYILEITGDSTELLFDIYDKDDVSKDDHMGLVVVNIRDLPDGSTVDTWFDVKKNRKSSTNQGQLHVKIFKALERDLAHDTPFFKAVANGDWAKFTSMLPSLSASDVVLKDKSGNTPLHLFCLTCPNEIAEKDVVNALEVFYRAGADFAALNSKENQSPVHYAFRNGNESARVVICKWLSQHTRPKAPRGAVFGAATAAESFIQFCSSNRVPDSLLKFAFAGGYIPSEEEKTVILNHYPEAFDYVRVLGMLASAKISLEHFQTLAAEEINYESLIRLGPSEISKLGLPAEAQKLLSTMIDKERGDEDEDDIVKVSRTDSALRSMRLNTDVDRARRRRDSITALENFFKGQVDQTGHSWLIDPKGLEFNALVGEGAFAKVYKGQLELSSHKTVTVAIKNARAKILATPDQVDSLKKEFEVMAAVGSPHIVKFYGVCFTQGSLNLISEYCEKGNLQSVLKSEESIDLKLGLKFLLGSAKGLTTLHSWEPPIFHRDIKTLNILVTQDNLTKISDFGTSVFSKSATNQGVVGSLPWCAPEVLAHGTFTDKADIYSFAIVMWEVLNRVLTGKYSIPYGGSKFNTDSEFIIQHAGGLRPTIPAEAPENLKALVERCWAPNPADRPSATEVLTALTNIQAALQ